MPDQDLFALQQHLVDVRVARGITQAQLDERIGERGWTGAFEAANATLLTLSAFQRYTRALGGRFRASADITG